jgi:uncharacterized peroxidase-related enzyme
MHHINLPGELPGISSVFAYRPEVAAPMRELAERLLLGDNTLSSSELETIATFVSTLNDCTFCRNSHRAAAAHNEGGSYEFVDAACSGFENAQVSSKLKALLAIAEKVQRGGKHVLGPDIANAREQGATDLEIHDTVLIAAAFCMYNRYVDGLASYTPSDPGLYDRMGIRLAKQGYVTATAETALTASR